MCLFDFCWRFWGILTHNTMLCKILYHCIMKYYYCKYFPISCYFCTEFDYFTPKYQRICYDNSGNVPNKGRNFNTQKFGKMYLFVICMMSRRWFQTKLVLYIALFWRFWGKNVIFSLYNQPKTK